MREHTACSWLRTEAYPVLIARRIYVTVALVTNYKSLP